MNRLTGLLLLGVIASGCGGVDGPDIASVRGRITMDGKPLPHASVVFIPIAGGRPAAASTDENGEYTLNFSAGREGAMLGEHKIRISTLRDPGEDEEGNMIPGSDETVPMQYSSGAELRFTVEAGIENVANFDITSEGEIATDQIDPAEAGLTPEEEQAEREAAQED